MPPQAIPLSDLKALARKAGQTADYVQATMGLEAQGLSRPTTASSSGGPFVA